METTKTLFPELEAEITHYEQCVVVAEEKYAEALAALDGSPLQQARMDVEALSREVAFHQSQDLEGEFRQAEMILENTSEMKQYEEQLKRLSNWQPNIPVAFDQSKQKLLAKVDELVKVLETSAAPPALIQAHQTVMAAAKTGDLAALAFAQSQLEAAVTSAGIPPISGQVPPPPGTEAFVSETEAIQSNARAYASKPSEELIDAETRYAKACDQLQQEERKALADVRQAEKELIDERDRLANSKEKLAKLEQSAKGG